MEYEHLFWAEMLAGGIRFGNRSQGRFVWQIALKICLTNLMPDNLKPLIEGFEKVAMPPSRQVTVRLKGRPSGAGSPLARLAVA